MTVIPIVIGAFGTVTKGLIQGLGDLEIRAKCIVGIGQNTKKSPGDFKRLAVSQSTVENHQLTLV